MVPQYQNNPPKCPMTHRVTELHMERLPVPGRVYKCHVCGQTFDLYTPEQVNITHTRDNF